MPDTPNRPSVQQQGGIIAPQPIPMTFNVQTMRMDETQQAGVGVFHSPTGQFVTFLSAEGAEALASQLQHHAGTAKTGLIVAGAMAGLRENEAKS